MNKLHITLLMMAILSSSSLFSQNYCCTSAIEWTEATFSFGETFTVRYTFSEDPILLHGNTYHEVLKSISEDGDNWTPTGRYLRYADHKIYYANETEEFAIMDFSLNVNDEFQIPFGATYTVVKADTVELANGDRKRRLTVNCTGLDTLSIHWIDEVGSSESITNFESNCSFDYGHRVLCLWKNDTLVYDNPQFNSCWEEFLDVVDLQTYNIEYHPNPASNILNIADPEGHIQSITVTSPLGELLFKGKESFIAMERYAPGVYLLQFELKDGNTAVARILKQ